jgi:hypothetical protein
VLSQIVPLAAGHDLRQGDPARDRLVELQETGLCRAVAALGVADEPSLADRCRGRGGRTVAADHGRAP